MRSLLAALAALASSLPAQAAEKPTAPRVGVHVDAQGRTHKCTGLKPLKPGAYSQLKAAVERRTTPGGITPPATPVDLRPKVPEILDQDGYNCCAGCALAEGHRLAEIISGNPDPKDSVADIYDRCNDGVDEGADLASCINAATTPGVAPTSLVPQYQIPIETPCPGCAAARAANPLEHATFCPDQGSMLAAIESGRPVYFGIIVTNRFNPDHAGYIGTYGGIAEGGHAVLAVGCSATKNGFCYLVQNSWGKDWGTNGFCLLDSSWAQPQVYGAFALEGEKRTVPTMATATVGSPPTPSGTRDIVVGTYWQPGTPTASSLAVALAGSAATSLKLVSWELRDPLFAAALCSAATNGRSVQCVLNKSGGTNTIQHQLVSQLKTSGGTCWYASIRNRRRSNFLEADGVYTLEGSYYYSPTALQFSTYVTAVSGTPTASARIADFATLVSGGTLASSAPAGPLGSDRIYCGSDPSLPSCPNCPQSNNTILPPAPTPGPTPSALPSGKPGEVQLDVGPIHWIWKSPRSRLYSATANTTPGPIARGPIRRIVARIRHRRG